jgi:SulP family sulfate permease
MMRVPMVDMSGAYLLDDIIEKAHNQGAKVLITGMEPQVYSTLDKLKIIERVGTENCFDTFEEAAMRVKELDLELEQSKEDNESNTEKVLTQV